MSEEPVRLDVAGGTGTITIDSPANRNALSQAVTAGLVRQLDAALADQRVRVIVLSATGTTFCAGADLKEQRVSNEQGVTAQTPNSIVAVFTRILHSPKPVVGRINGHARAGGMGLMASCDIAVAVDVATFGFSEVRLGLTPAVISAVTLPKMGITNGMEYFLTGDVFSAARAKEMHLVNAVAPAEGLDEAVGRYVDSLLKGAPNALAGCKKLVRDVPGLSYAEAFPMLEAISARYFGTPEALEGMTAFAEKRPPRWTEQR